VIVLCSQLAFAITAKDAALQGKEFLEEHMNVGHKGISVEEYNIKPMQTYQTNDMYYTLYKVTSTISDKDINRNIIIQMDLEGNIIDIYTNQVKEQTPLIF